MHGCSLESPFLVNAEVDYMGSFVDYGVGIGTTSPRQAAIEKVQAELRQENDVIEERRRELEFLENGGNPLDFRLRNAASVRVESTSLNDQPPEQFVTSEAEGCFALTASPHGDSLERSGRPGAPTVCEPICADNLLLFDHESKFFEGETNSLHPTRSNIPSSEEQLNESQDACLPKGRKYKRRNMSRPNRHAARSVPSRGGPKDGKRLLLCTNNKDHQNDSSNCNSNPSRSIALKVLPSDGQVDVVLDNVQALGLAIGLTEVGLSEPPCDFNTSKSMQGKPHSQHTQVDAEETSTTAKTEDQTTSAQRNGFRDDKGARESITDKGEKCSAAFSTKGLDSESSCTQTSHSLDANNGSDLCNHLRHVDSNGNTKEQTFVFEETPHVEGDEMLNDCNEKEADGIESYASINVEHSSVNQSHQSNRSVIRAEKQVHGNGSDMQNEVKCQMSFGGMEIDGSTASETDRKPGNSLGDNLTPQKESDHLGRFKSSMDYSVHDGFNTLKEKPCDRHQSSMNPGMPELMKTTASLRGSADSYKQQICGETQSKLANKAHEDSILEEAQIIEAKRKRIAELSAGTLVSKNHRTSQWEIVLEEMAWLANDFAQERLWKITAAAQLGHQIAATSQLRFEEQNLDWKQKKVAHSLAKAIIEFWHSAQEMSKEVELQCRGIDFTSAVQGYAVRFLRCNNSLILIGLAEASPTPDRVSDLGIKEMSSEDHFTEENLFYAVPSGAMETYRKLIEFQLAEVEKTGGSVHEEADTSYVAAEDNAYDEDEGETRNYYLPGGFEGKKPSKFAEKKRKNLTKSCAGRSYNLGTDPPFTQCLETKVGSQHLLMGKRPANDLTVGSIPTKRMRTPSRLRVLCPFSTGTSGGVQGPNKTDASSGDTNFFQDDPEILHGWSQNQNDLEVESGGDFKTELPFHSTEVSKPKKKKAKHMGSIFEERWKLDNDFFPQNDFRNEQRDHSKSRLDNYHLESNGSIGLVGQHITKKPKMMRQPLENLFDNNSLMSGSISSPLASQMSNVSVPNKLIKILAGRGQGRKAKVFKMPAGQPGPGSPWSLLEDQALVVLVHDMGPYWELVSDAFNSALLFKGSARQLFQCLQGPMEADMIKTHFQKIITISQKLLCRITENDYQDAEPIQPHNSHTAALSQVCPNNLNGGGPLTPLDLCDTTASSPDILSLGYQGSQASGLPISNQSTVASVLPASGAIYSSLGSSHTVDGSNFSPPYGPLNALVRDGRYGVLRSASFSIDEHRGKEQYNHMSGRNIHHSGLSVDGAPPGTDCGIRMLSGGDIMGIARPGFQGNFPSAILNSGSMLSSSAEAMPSQVNLHSGVGSAQGNLMLRPRDALNMMRPVQNPEHMVLPELQMQATKGNSQGAVPPFGGLSSAFSNQTSFPPVRTFPIHQQQQHQTSPPQSHVISNPHLHAPNHASTQHQAYPIHVAKERQLQQQRLLQQHRQFTTSNALMPHVHPQQPQLQGSYQGQPQTTSATISLPLAQTSSTSPMSQQKLHMTLHGLNKNPQTGGSGLTKYMGKQRQPQQQSFQQSRRNHPQHQQQSQSQQQAKILKGVGRGNMVMHQNLPNDFSSPDGFSGTPYGQSAEKTEQVLHLVQSQGFYPGSRVHPVQPSKPLGPPHFSNLSRPQQKMHSGQAIIKPPEATATPKVDESNSTNC
ncbi:hypothetical protein RHMOL_Rhmol13G0056700 [Rhododendron molle]|uniref:Uncharacterized protein n=2 Tax=Rhododendron molle TaxID=49168 RepID=A0ACC0L3D5_RHOML|nr:hypothetical protein RHMOL_Rhmol13G0056700 [Rhododendron molle]KAI8523226.1 hypothetical protein RHMOL_Rhmol13G0056700 [Rhododendron molle]